MCTVAVEQYTVQLENSQKLLPDVLDLVLPTRFWPMPGLISSTVGFSNVIFNQLRQSQLVYPMNSTNTLIERQRERGIYGSVDRYTHIHVYVIMAEIRKHYRYKIEHVNFYKQKQHQYLKLVKLVYTTG